MKKIIFSNKTPKSGVDLVTLLLRLSFGLLIMVNHGWPKVSKFDQISPEFVRFMGLSSQTSLGLAVFAEFFCAFLIIFGLFTRFALIPLMITMLMALHVKDWQLIGQGNNELAMVFLMGFLTLFILGPGKYSMDAMIQKSRR